MTEYVTKRIYDVAEPSDGCRILVDRLWPRGVSKSAANLDAWYKEVGPSNELRSWFGHDPDKYSEFKRRYKAELRNNPAFDELRTMAQECSIVTLLFGAKDETHNQAVVLKEVLDSAS